MDFNIHFDQTDNGLLAKYENEHNVFTFCFGNTSGPVANFSEKFDQFKFKRIKQVHGDKIVHTSPHTIDYSSEADAHYTTDENLALCVLTADCFPIFIFDRNQKHIFSIHAGWRGIANRIVIKALQKAKSFGCDMNNTLVIAGPHIQKENFEIKNDVRDQLLASVKPKCLASNPVDQIDSEKCLLDLNTLLRAQLKEMEISPNHIFISNINTVTDTRFHSYRRDRENAGRQISWIVREKRP